MRQQFFEGRKTNKQRTVKQKISKSANVAFFSEQRAADFRGFLASFDRHFIAWVVTLRAKERDAAESALVVVIASKEEEVKEEEGRKKKRI